MATIAATTLQSSIGTQSLHATNMQLWDQAMLDAGFVLTADPQTDLSSYVTPVNRIYRMDDTQQSAAPIFIKNTFTVTSNYIRHSATAGTGSNGSGTITGPTVSWAANHTTGNVTGAGAILASGADGYACVYQTGLAGMATHIYVQRFVDSETGVANSEGWAFRDPTTGGLFAFSVALQQWTTNTQITASLFNKTVSVNPNTFETMRSWVRCDGEYKCIPSLVHTHVNESVYGVLFTASPLGHSYTYMPVNNSASSVYGGTAACVGTANTASNFRPAIRWA